MVTNGKISFVVSFFHCYLSVSHVILSVVMLNSDLFVQNINISDFFLTFSVFCLFGLFCLFCFYILYFILFRVFATVVTINKADCPVNFTISHCRICTNQSAWRVCITSECWHTRCWHFCSCSFHKTIPSLRELDVTQHWSR